MLQNIFVLNLKSKKVSYLITNVVVIGFIFLIPALSHLTSIPFYLVEPMRISILFCIILTERKNAMVVALTIPLISMIATSHPDIIKSILISLELAMNVSLFYNISERLNNKFIVMFLSILLAKIFYYSLKFLLLSLGVMQGNLVSTPLWIQYLIIIILSIVAAFALREKKNST